MNRNRISVLRNRDFRRLWLAGWLSLCGSEAGAIAIILFLFRDGHSVAGLALLMILRTLPAGVVAPLAGIVIDRADKRTVMVAADLVRAALLAIAIVFRSTPLLYVVCALNSVAGAFFEPARSAALPSLLRPGDLPDANGLDQTMWNVTMIGGPVAGALLSARFGLGAALGLDAFSFLLSAALICGLRVPRTPALPGVAPGAWSEARAGWIHLWRTPALRQVTLLWFLSTLAVGMWVPLAPFFNRDALHVGDEAIGYQIGVLGAAGALGGSLAAAACRRFRPGALLFGAMMLEAIHIILFSFSPNLAWSIAVLAPWGVVVSVIFVVAESLLQTCAAPAMLGRVMSTVKQGEHLATLGSMAVAVTLSRLFTAREIFRVAGFFYLAVIAAAMLTGSGRVLRSMPCLEPSTGESGGDRANQEHELEPDRLPVLIDK